MKLSDAILLGSVGTEQGVGNTSMFLDFPGKCALGAALVAVGKCVSYEQAVANDYFEHPYVVVKNIWPWIHTTMVEHPVTGGVCRVIECIYSLNDRGWTRPQIAAWVATLETEHDPAPVKREYVPEPESVNII